MNNREEIEVWKPVPVPGFETFYEVSSLGKVKSLRRNKLMAPCKNHRGYLTVTLYKNRNERRTVKIHRLVLFAFLGAPDPKLKLEVHHENSLVWDNRLSNLSLCNHRENNSHSWLHGRRLDKKKKTSKYIGVYYNKHMGRWQARLWIDRRYKSLGYYNDEVTAHRAYLKALREHGIQNRYAD